MYRPFRLSLAVAVLVLTGTVAASAAPVTPIGKKLASGVVAVGTCGSTAGVTVTYNTRSSTVLGVTVRNLPSSCNGASLSATVSNAANTDLGHGGPVVVASQIAAVTMSANPTTASVTKVLIVLVGP